MKQHTNTAAERDEASSNYLHRALAALKKAVRSRRDLPKEDAAAADDAVATSVWPPERCPEPDPFDLEVRGRSLSHERSDL
eukprot:m51a1_g5225 hypothetical protein (81) ;mRNA; f:275591-275896